VDLGGFLEVDFNRDMLVETVDKLEEKDQNCRHYFYEYLRRRLNFLFTNFFGTAL
jgi:hypothetical protein